MDREIKFRIWDNAIKTFSFISLNSDMIGMIAFQFYPKRTFLQQYIGLNDKDGKEIYEGDIVREYGYDQNRTIEESEDHHLHELFEIKYGNHPCGNGIIGSVFYLAPIGKSAGRTNAGLFNVNALNRIKIIGNIFENSELLGA